jgi:hypothetical protein
MSSGDGAAESPEQLRADLEALQAQLAPVLARDRARVEAEGRPFDLVSWALGVPDSHKYPGGPAFLVSGRVHCGRAGGRAGGRVRASASARARGRQRKRRTREGEGKRRAGRRRPPARMQRQWTDAWRARCARLGCARSRRGAMRARASAPSTRTHQDARTASSRPPAPLLYPSLSPSLSLSFSLCLSPQPMGKEATVANSMAQISGADAAWTAAGAAVFYAFGAANAARLGVRGSHVFGLWTAVPAVVLGLMGATHRGWYRYMGFTDNGNPPLYPGYVESQAPYFVRHAVSDRHFKLAPGAQVHGLKDRSVSPTWSSASTGRAQASARVRARASVRSWRARARARAPRAHPNRKPLRPAPPSSETARLQEEQMM